VVQAWSVCNLYLSHFFVFHGALGSVGPCQNTLVTYLQDGHSYPISPGSSCIGAMLTTSSIVALHRGHAILPRLFDRSDTNDLGFSSPLTSVNASWGELVAALRPLWFC
jgi:hypothetical protein